MKALQARNKLVAKQIRLPDGREVLALFSLSEVAGKLDIRLISYKELSVPAEATLALPAPKISISIAPHKDTRGELVISPYINQDFFYAQPIRGPSRGF
jgi:hypothetical protein